MRSHSNTQVRDSQIIQHEAPLVITNPVNHLCVYDNRIERIKSGIKRPTF